MKVDIEDYNNQFISKALLIEILALHGQCRTTPLSNDLEYACREINPKLPIDDKAKDGRELLLYEGSFMAVGSWSKALNEFCIDRDMVDRPTHYRELP